MRTQSGYAPAIRSPTATNLTQVTGDTPEYSLYHELADWWPLISPPGEYVADAAEIVAAFGTAQIPVHDVLDLGSGGGHVAAHLKDHYSLTLVDLSPDMLAVSRRLNPECLHLPGDMLTVRLQRLFDGVLVHDAVDYVTGEADLRLVIDTAFAHCRDGGVAVFAPDHTAETFLASTGGGGGDGTDGRRASFRERTSDPDSSDDWILAEYEFTLRDASGGVRVVREAHRLGSFRRDTWLALLVAAGFTAETRVIEEAYVVAGDAGAAGAAGAAVEAVGAVGAVEERRPRRVMFVGHRPVAAGTGPG
jgi:SAM-dependent methyltransferase